MTTDFTAFRETGEEIAHMAAMNLPGLQENRIARLEMLATRDELTGLYNRHGLSQALLAELDRCERGCSKGGLLMLIDLDNFQAINEKHGPAAGEACLKLVAGTLQNEVRAMDAAARLGGGEFALLFGHAIKMIASTRAQTLAWNLNHLALAWHGEEIPLRASLGLKEYKAGDRADMIFDTVFACRPS